MSRYGSSARGPRPWPAVAHRSRADCSGDLFDQVLGQIADTPSRMWAFQVNSLRVAVNFSDVPAAVGAAAGPVVASSAPDVLDDGMLAAWSAAIIKPAS